MPTAIVKLDKNANKVINIVKAKYDLKDKSSAINKLAEEYGDEFLEPELRPSYIKKIQEIERKGKFKKLNHIEEMWK